MQIDLSTIFHKFSETKVLVVGDVMLDTYLWGTSSRMSPEAPVPVIDIINTEHRLGGAANVVLNLMALGAKTQLCTMVGDDKQSEIFVNLLRKNNIDAVGVLYSNTRPTTQKNRVMNGLKQAIRYDIENCDDLNEQELELLCNKFLNIVLTFKPDIIIIQDYNKGVLSEIVINYIITTAKQHQILIAVDPKKKNFFAYKNVDLFKPNLKETKDALQLEIDIFKDDEILNASEILFNKIQPKNILITLSEKGILGFNNNHHFVLPAHHRNIVDVSGAGDTVISVATLCLAQHLPLNTVAQLANIGGGLVCEKAGVSVIDIKAFLKESISVFAN